ncbi:hypothetical protein [uncultured Paraglaciecola sp.]|uniref:hypothetical protein n=1 Tax=uncultured Paraglaciecola sp. TaxID=1765024 RepID=UPI002621E716|nr:hypothetical protein [uncultured Paraglaciecola sp.]
MNNLIRNLYSGTALFGPMITYEGEDESGSGETGAGEGVGLGGETFSEDGEDKDGETKDGDDGEASEAKSGEQDGDDDGDDKSGDGDDDLDEDYVDDPDKTEEENAEARAAHEKEREEKKKTAEEDEDALKAEDYTIETPDGFQLDTEIETEFRTFAEERKMSQEDVDTLVTMQRKMQEKAAVAHATQIKEWGQELKADKVVGGPNYNKTINAGIKVVEDVFVPFDKNFKAILNQTGFGVYPPFVKGMARLGEMMSEAGIITGKETQAEQTHEEILYGNSEE